MSNPFVKAVKEQAKLRMALIGASGSGKTWTALQIASTLAALEGGRMALIDTEGRSARLYANHFDFDVLDLSKNYAPAEYIKAINAAVENGYKVLVIDSLTHAWNGAGGVLSIVDKAASKIKDNKFAGWSEGRPAQNTLVEAILNSNIHIIGTMRAKADYVMQTDPITGKTKPVEVGIAPVQDGDFKYEFTITAMMDRSHVMTIDKSRCSAVEMGEEITDTDWLSNTLYQWLVDGDMPNKPVIAWHARSDAKTWLAKQLGQFPNVSNTDFKQINPDATGWSSLNITEAELLRWLADLNQPKAEQPAPPQDTEPSPADTIRGNASDQPTGSGFNVTPTPAMLERARMTPDDAPLTDEERAIAAKELAELEHA